jgi:hypothetical protein
MSGTWAGFSTSYAEPLRSETEMGKTGYSDFKKAGFDRNGGVLSFDDRKKSLDLSLVLWSIVIPGTAASFG